MELETYRDEADDGEQRKPYLTKQLEPRWKPVLDEASVLKRSKRGNPHQQDQSAVEKRKGRKLKREVRHDGRKIVLEFSGRTEWSTFSLTIFLIRQCCITWAHREPR